MLGECQHIRNVTQENHCEQHKTTCKQYIYVAIGTDHANNSGPNIGGHMCHGLVYDAPSRIYHQACREADQNSASQTLGRVYERSLAQGHSYNNNHSCRHISYAGAGTNNYDGTNNLCHHQGNRAHTQKRIFRADCVYGYDRKGPIHATAHCLFSASSHFNVIRMAWIALLVCSVVVAAPVQDGQEFLYKRVHHYHLPELTIEDSGYMILNEDPTCYGYHDYNIIQSSDCDMPSYCGLMKSYVVDGGLFTRSVLCYPADRHGSHVVKVQLIRPTKGQAIGNEKVYLLTKEGAVPRYRAMATYVYERYPTFSTMADYTIRPPSFDEQNGCSMRFEHMKIPSFTAWTKDRIYLLNHLPLYREPYDNEISLSRIHPWRISQNYVIHTSNNMYALTLSRDIMSTNQYCVPMLHTTGHIVGMGRITSMATAIFRYLWNLLVEVVDELFWAITELIQLVNRQYKLLEAIIVWCFVAYKTRNNILAIVLVVVLACIFGPERS